MKQRPLSLTIIGWFLVVTGLFGLYSVATMGSNDLARQIIEDNGMSLPFQQAMAGLGVLIALITAYGIFRGMPWSRVLYVGWSAISLIVGLVTSPFKGVMILSVLFIAVIAYFLFRPAADAWFAAKGLELKRNDG